MMPLSIYLHYISYEAVRSVAMAMISSEAAGFVEGSGFQWVVKLNVPFSALILYSYSFCQRYYGNKWTIRCSNALIIVVMVAMSWLFVYNHQLLATPWGQAANVLFHIYSQTYCSLHASYAWGFVLDNYYYANGRAEPADAIAMREGDDEKGNMVVIVGSFASLSSVLGSFVLYYLKGSIGVLLLMAIVCSSLSWAQAEVANAIMAVSILFLSLSLLSFSCSLLAFSTRV
jgi:hypothetical protein